MWSIQHQLLPETYTVWSLLVSGNPAIPFNLWSFVLQKITTIALSGWTNEGDTVMVQILHSITSGLLDSQACAWAPTNPIWFTSWSLIVCWALWDAVFQRAVSLGGGADFMELWSMKYLFHFHHCSTSHTFCCNEQRKLHPVKPKMKWSCRFRIPFRGFLCTWQCMLGMCVSVPLQSAWEWDNL